MENIINSFYATLGNIIIIPLAFFCYIPIYKYRKTDTKKIFINLFFHFLFAIAFIFCVFLFFKTISYFIVFVFFMLYFFNVYSKDFDIPRPRLLFIFSTACLIGGLSFLFYNYLGVILYPSGNAFSLIFNIKLTIYQIIFEVFLIAVFFIPAKKYLGWMIVNFENEKIWFFASLFPLFFAFISRFLIFYEHKNAYIGRFFKIYTLVLFSSFCVILLLYIMFYLYVKNLVENKNLQEKTAYFDIQTEQFRQLQRYLQETSRLRHDFRHNIITISNLAKKNKFDDLKNYIYKYSKNIETPFLHYTSSFALNSILSHYKTLFYEYGIFTDFFVKLNNNIPIDDIDFCVLLGNLLENAMNALRNVHEDNKKITLKIGQTSENIIAIQINNTHTNKIIVKNNIFMSTTHDGMGQGLKSVRIIVEKYNGNMDINYDSKEFEVKILLKF